MIRVLAALLCLAVAAGFAALAAAPWLAAPEALGPVRAAAEGGNADDEPFSAAATPALDLARIAARPLFSAARRPPPPEAPGAPLVDPMADLLFRRYEVTGVVMLGDGALAMLRDATNGALIRLRPGDEVETANGSAELVEATLDRLTFRRGGATVAAPVRGQGAATE